MRVPRIDVSPSIVEEVGGDVGYVRVVVLEGDPRHWPPGALHPEENEITELYCLNHVWFRHAKFKQFPYFTEKFKLSMCYPSSKYLHINFPQILQSHVLQ